MRLGATFGTLAEREFRLLFLGRLVSFLGSAFAPVAIAFAVLQVGSASDLGLVLAASMLPTVVFVLVGGVIADRLPRHAVLVVTNSASGAAQGLFAVVIVSGHAQLWELIAIQAVRGVSTAFFFPAAQGIVPEVVSAGRLQEANVLLRLSRNTTSILGAAVAGIVVAAVGPAWGLAVDAASYVLAALFLARIDLPPRPRRETPAFVRELVEGWDEFRSRTWLWVVVVAFGVYWDTSLQQHVPREALSRVSSYDALGSWVLMPIGFAVVGPIAAIAGTRATLLGASALVWLAVLAMAATGDIRRLAAAPSAA